MMDRCPNCDREKPTPEDWAHPSGCACGRCVTLCWGDCDPVDWRERALVAEAEAERLASGNGTIEVTGAAFVHSDECERLAEALRIKAEEATNLRHSTAVLMRQRDEALEYAEACKDRLDEDTKWLREEREKALAAAERLRREMPELDCRYTGGPVADTGGVHCPPPVPCARCRAEKAEAEVERLRGKHKRAQRKLYELVCEIMDAKALAFNTTEDRTVDDVADSLDEQLVLQVERFRGVIADLRAEVERLRTCGPRAETESAWDSAEHNARRAEKAEAEAARLTKILQRKPAKAEAAHYKEV